MLLTPFHPVRNSHLLGPPPPSSVTYFMDGPSIVLSVGVFRGFRVQTPSKLICPCYKILTMHKNTPQINGNPKIQNSQNFLLAVFLVSGRDLQRDKKM